jgi:MFS family permease
MTSPGFFQPAVFAFATAMALIWAAVIAHRIRRDERTIGWALLAAFAGALGAAALCGLMAAVGSSIAPLRLAQLGLAAGGFLALVEFGRRELRGRFRTLKKPWIYAVLVAAAVIKFALAGSAGLVAVCAYVLAPLGGFLAAVAIAQRAQTRRNGAWGLPLLAAAVAFFAIGFALSVAALQAFAALGLLAGIWRLRREESPFPQHTPALVQWRAPGAFIILTLLGCAGLVSFGKSEQAASVVAQAGAPGEPSDATSAAAAVDGIEIDSRHLARERAAAQRYKQGVSILVVVVIVAAVWVGLSRLQRRL